MTWTMAALVVVAGILGTSPAEAAKCSISATSVVFGTYDVFSTAPVDSTGSVIVDCSGGAKNVTLAISRGQSGSYAPRTLKQGAEALAYNLFTDAGRSTVWGDGSGGSQSYVVGNPPNNAVTYTIYGRIPAQQDISFGAYGDAVTVTINF